MKNRNAKPEEIIAALVLSAVLIAAFALYEYAYPCRRYETRAATRTTCYTTSGNMTNCTTRPETEKVCVDRGRR